MYLGERLPFGGDFFQRIQNMSNSIIILAGHFLKDRLIWDTLNLSLTVHILTSVSGVCLLSDPIFRLVPGR